MLKNLFTLIICLLGIGASAQLVNKGANITVQVGATLVVEGNLSNEDGGTITNNGIIQIKGNLDNKTGTTFTNAVGSILAFYGNTASSILGDPVLAQTVDIDKSGADVTLSTGLTIVNNLDFESGNTGKLVLGTQDLTLENGASVTGDLNNNSHINASSTGMVQKNSTSAGVFDFPIGDGTSYTPIQVNASGTFGGSSNLRVNTASSASGNLPADADAYLDRIWNVNANNITGYAATLTGTYAASDVVGTETLIKGASYDASTGWTYMNASGDDVGNTVAGNVDRSTEDFTGTNFYGELDLKVFLQGAYTTGSTMNTTLNSILPLTSPYNGSITVGSIPNGNIVDWIEIQTRDGATPISSYSKFLLNDGSIVELDGVSKVSVKDIPQDVDIAINHRNHLSIMTPSKIDLINTGSGFHSFSSNLTEAYSDPGILSNTAMVELSSTPLIYGLYSGNATGDGVTNFADLITVRNDSTPNQAGVYNRSDMNFDGILNFIDLINTRDFSTPNKQAHIK